jgi:hypothetical protein
VLAQHACPDTSKTGHEAVVCPHRDLTNSPMPDAWLFCLLGAASLRALIR